MQERQPVSSGNLVKKVLGDMNCLMHHNTVLTQTPPVLLTALGQRVSCTAKGEACLGPKLCRYNITTKVNTGSPIAVKSACISVGWKL